MSRARDRKRPPAPTADQDAIQRRAQAAMALWGCPRPDKTHHLTQDGAQHRLDRIARTTPGHEPAEVYRCPCGGWVWGRPHGAPHPPTGAPTPPTTAPTHPTAQE